ncbi:MAG: autotransporter-associated beta strand repeat-containing protein, partial [Planctomycetaceae bacterium]|nr:autotransporter-associated beta strand repeat-containing protein [Planctomycetaceae bacterium]
MILFSIIAPFSRRHRRCGWYWFNQKGETRMVSMARKLLVITGFIAAFTLVSFHGINSSDAATHTTIGSLNLELGVQVANGTNVILNKDLNPPWYYIFVDGQDIGPMTGNGNGGQFNLAINKAGVGLWRLDNGDNNVAAATTNYFNVNAGTLELMGTRLNDDGTRTANGTTITLGGAAAATEFRVRSGATLNSREKNRVSAPTIRFDGGATIGLDLTHSTGDGTAQLALAGGNTVYDFTSPTDPHATINLLGFHNVDAPELRLIDFQYAYTGNGAPEDPGLYYPGWFWIGSNVIGANTDIKVRGEALQDVITASGGRLTGDEYQTAVGWAATNASYIAVRDFSSRVGAVQWTGSTDNKWNATSANWTGINGNNLENDTPNINTAGSNTFLHGDLALFGATSGEKLIAVQSGGVQIGNLTTLNNYNLDFVPGMIVNAGEYRFTNENNSLIGIDGPGGVLITSAADNPIKTKVTFASPNSYWGKTLVENGSALHLNTSGSAGTGAIELKTGAQLVFATNIQDDYFQNAISLDAGTTLTKEGTNNLTFGSIVYGEGDTVIKSGTLRGNIGRGLLTVYEGATYSTSYPYPQADGTGMTTLGDNRTIKGLSNYFDPVTMLPNTGGTVNMGQYTLYIDAASVAGPRGQGWEFSGLITGNGTANEGFEGNIAKYGSGIQILSNISNTYSGGTTVGAGTLVGRTTLSDDIPVFRPFGTGTVTVKKDATLRFDLFRDPAANPDDPAYTAAFGNAIHGEGTVLKSGAIDNYGDPVSGEQRSTETLYLTSNGSTYTGKTDIREGNIRIRSIFSTGKTSEVALATGTALQFDPLADSAPATPYDRVITGTGNVEILYNDTNKTVAYVGGYNRTDSAGNPATDSTVHSDYSGKTVVERNSELHILDVYATGNTSAVELQETTSDLYLEFETSKDENGRERDQVYNRYITGSGNVFKQGEGVVVLELGTNPNDYTGTTAVNSGTLKLNYADATGAADVYDEQNVTVTQSGILELAFDGTYNKGITGAGILAKSGEGTTSYLNGKSDYTGGTYLYSGTLSYSDLDIDTPGNLGRGGVSFLRGGGTLQNRNEVESFDRKVSIYAGSTATFDTKADLTMTGSQGIQHQIVEESDPYYIAGGQKSNFVKTGAATMTINSTAAWTGTTVVKDGVLANNIPDGTELTLNSPGTYYTGKSNRTVSLLSGDGGVQTEQGYNFTVNNSKDSLFAGGITGGGSFVKDGIGTLQLTGSNTYTGGTLIKNGTLTGNIASGTDLTVNAAGTYISTGNSRIFGSLQGSGTVDMKNGIVVIRQTNTAANPVFTGKILNADRLVKSGDGTQTFAGLQYKFSGDIAVEAGTLKIGGANSTPTQLITDKWVNVSDGATLFLDRKGKAEAVNGNVNIDGTLVINLDNNSITAESFSFGSNSQLDVRGIGTSETMVPVLTSSTAIEDNFASVSVGGESANVDYLTLGVSKSADKKIMYVGQSLSWYAATDAHGNFTLTGADNSFEVSRELADVFGTFDPALWDGKTLTKKGIGTLILSAANTYTGQTVVESGTLKLKNEKATGGSSGVVLGDKTALEIAFDSRDKDGNWTNGYATSISGTGEVVKTGNGSIALLTGYNSYTGYTKVEQGGLLVDGMLASPVWVRELASFGGNGIVNDNVYLEDGSRYYWRYGTTEEKSDMLTVDNLHIGENVIFKPVANKLDTQ